MSSDLVVAILVQSFVTVAALVMLRTLALGHASRNWPTVQGQVERLEVVSNQVDGGTTYKPRIIYRYRVGAREYQGRRIRATTFGGGFSDQAAARAMLDGYYPGSAVTVHYHPRRPGNSLLRPGVTSMQWTVGALLVATTLALAACFVVVFSG